MPRASETGTVPRCTARAAILGLAVFVIALVGWIALGSSTTRQAVGNHVVTMTIPRYAKVLDFLRRHEQYRVLAREITQTATSDEERARALFTWTREHVRPSPPGWTVVDDHVLNVIRRGHGAGYQIVDVFATLTTYAGMPAFWQPRRSDHLVFPTFVLIDGQWTVFDVLGGVIFTNSRGELADAREIVPDVKLPPDRPLRVELQMPWPRVVYETQQAMGMPWRNGRP